MSEEPKTTVSDYIKALFAMADNMEQPCEQDERQRVLVAANELKAAWERERAEIAAKAATEAVMLTNEKWKRAGGNAVMLREALNKVGNICLYVKENCAEMDTAKYMAEAIDSIKAALADPPRNCDVGTAKEQEQRYLKLKKEHVDRLTFCPHVGYAAFFPDSLYWAQMPYEATQEGDSNENK